MNIIKIAIQSHYDPGCLNGILRNRKLNLINIIDYEGLPSMSHFQVKYEYSNIRLC
jgi:hypothetical protein